MECTYAFNFIIEVTLSSEKFLVCGNVSDSPVAIDIARLLGLTLDVSDIVSLKTYSNTEFCPRFISSEQDLENIGDGLKGASIVIVSGNSASYDRNSLAMRNMVLARAAKENGAERVILVEPDLFYSAQDRGPQKVGDKEMNRSLQDLKKFDGQPFTALLYAQLLKASGVDTVLTVHNHSDKVQDLFREVFGGDFHNLIPSDVYADYIKKSDMVECGKDGDNLVLVAPDHGARPFMNLVFNALNLPKAKRVIMKKVRTGERAISMSIDPQSEITNLDEIEGKDLIILDDMVRTGTTIVKCCEALKEAKPNRVCFAVTHFHTSSEARENLNSSFIDEIMTTNSIPTILNRDLQGRLRRKLTVLKLGKWISRHAFELFGIDDDRYDKDFYSIDMSSQNPRWPPPTA